MMSPVSRHLETPCSCALFLQVILASAVVIARWGPTCPVTSSASEIETSTTIPTSWMSGLYISWGCGLSTGFVPVQLGHALAKSIFPSLGFDLVTLPSMAAPASSGRTDAAIKTREVPHHQISPANVWGMVCAWNSSMTWFPNSEITDHWDEGTIMFYEF